MFRSFEYSHTPKMTILYPWGSLLKGTEYFFLNVHWHNVCRHVSHVGLEMRI